MKRKFAVIGIFVSLILTVGSCSKDLGAGTDADRLSSTINLTVNASLPDYDEATKGSLVKNIRVCWSENDVVYVYDNKTYLGTLTAKLEDGNDRYAVLSGTITSSSASKLTLVAAEGLTPDVATQDASIISGVKFDLSSQSLDKDQAPYVVYAVIDNPTGTGVSGIKTSFSFATSVINVNCTALKEGTAVSKATLNSVNTVLTITPKADAVPTLTSGTEGTITRTGAEYGALGAANAEGVLIFSVAVLDQKETSDRKIHVSQSGWPSSASFSAAALTKGASYNTVCQLSGPYKTIGGHSGVRLWADGPYWATCNIGAESPTDYGYYYMWGYTQGYEYRDEKFYKAGTDTEIASGGFSWTNYTKFGTRTENTPDYGLNKYNSTGPDTLEPIDDAAAIEWGSGWRMPTCEEFNKLKDNCVWKRNTELGGYLVTGKEEYAGISVFFPAAGSGNGFSFSDAGNVGRYWSSSLDTQSYVQSAHYLYFDAGKVEPQDQVYRYYGRPVRPVSD